MKTTKNLSGTNAEIRKYYAECDPEKFTQQVAELISNEFINRGEKVPHEIKNLNPNAAKVIKKIAKSVSDEEFADFLKNQQVPAIKLSNKELEVLIGGKFPWIAALGSIAAVAGGSATLGTAVVGGVACATGVYKTMGGEH